MINIYKEIIICIGLIFLPTLHLAEGKQELERTYHSQWVKTEAQFKLMSENIKNLKTDKTVLGELIRQTEKKPEDLLEKDGETLIAFEIRYSALVEFKDMPSPKKTEIIQYGLFRDLPSSLQTIILESKPNSLNIRYKAHDPIFIEFLIGKKSFKAPTLLTKTIDKYWLYGDKHN